jgi:hypothetical protein
MERGINKKIIFLLFLLSTFYFLLSVTTVFAAAPAQPPPSPPTGGYLLEGIDCIKTGQCQLIDILKLGLAVSNFILKYVGVIFLIFLIVGGVMWIVASGNPERIKRGKSILTGSLIGILIVFFAWQIVNLVICAVSGGVLSETCTIFGKGWNIFPQ